MAVRPSDVMRQSSRIQLQIQDLERHIDEHLCRTEFNYEGVIAFAIPPNTTAAVRAGVEDVYRRNGWKVRVVSDERDGTYWEFRAI